MLNVLAKNNNKKMEGKKRNFLKIICTVLRKKIKFKKAEPFSIKKKNSGKIIIIYHKKKFKENKPKATKKKNIQNDNQKRVYKLMYI